MLDIIISQTKISGMPRIAPPVALTEAQSEELQRICRAGSSSGAEVLRARIILLAANGSANDEIVHELSTNKMTVSKWRRRFAQLGMAGLQDAARPGRPATLSAEVSPRRAGPEKA